MYKRQVEASANEKIHLYTYSEVEKVSGFVGDFTVDIRKKARSVDMSKCTGCGVCQMCIRDSLGTDERICKAAGRGKI